MSASDAPSTGIRVVVIDDHAMVAESLALALGAAGIDVVGQAPTLAKGVAMVAEVRPNVVLLDFRLPDGDGIEGLAAIQAAHPNTPVLVLTAVADDRTAIDVMAAGAAGYLTKDRAMGDLVHAVTTAAAGQTVMGSDLFASVLARMRAPQVHDGFALTAREREALQLLATGLGVDQVAASMGVSRNTARKYVQAVLQKLGAHTQLEAVALARRSSLLAPSD